MNRGFAFYFKNAFKSSVATIWKNRNILQVTGYFLAELVARLTLIFSAVFDLADIRQAKIVEEKRRMDIPQTLQVAMQSKPVWTMVFSIVAEALIFLGGTLIIAAITGIFALLGFAIAYAANGPLYIVLIFCIPGGILFLAYSVLAFIIFSPTPYIVETNPTLGVAEVIKICLDTMKGRGKVTSFLNFFIPTLMECFVIGICVAGYLLIYFLMNSVYTPVVLAIWLIFSIALLVLTLPMFDLTKKLAQKSLFEDITLDPVNANKRTAGINIKNCTGVTFAPNAVKSNLVALFDETQPDSVPDPESPARKKVKEKAEKAAKKREQEAEQAEQAKQEETAEEQTEQVEEATEPVEPHNEPGQPHTEPVKPFTETEPVQPHTEPVKPYTETEPVQPHTEPVKPFTESEPVKPSVPEYEPVTPSAVPEYEPVKEYEPVTPSVPEYEPVQPVDYEKVPDYYSEDIPTEGNK